MPEATPVLRIGRTDFYIFAGLPEGDITQSDAEVLVSSAGTDVTHLPAVASRLVIINDLKPNSSRKLQLAFDIKPYEIVTLRLAL